MSRWLVITLLLIIAVSTGCGVIAQPQATAPLEAAAAPTPTAVVPESAIVEVRVGDAVMLGEDKGAQQFLQAQVDLFEKTHPQIKIVLEAWGWKAQEFPAQLAAGKVPDVMEVAATEGNLVINNGYAADLTSMMNTWAVSQDFNELILAPFTQADRLYGVPRVVYIMGMFYDKKLFKEAGLVDGDGEPTPPATWAEFSHIAKVIKEKTGAAGFCMLTQYNQGGWNFINWGWQAGGEFERQAGQRWQAVFDEPPIVEAMQFIRALRWEHAVLQDELLLDAGPLFSKIASHQCGMAIVTPGWFTEITKQGGNSNDLGLTILPAGPAGHANLMGGAYTIINANIPPEAQQAAFQWITWRGFSPQALESELKSPWGGNRWDFSSRSLMYKPNSPTTHQERTLLDKYHNLPYYRVYVENAGNYARPEPPIATQELYAALDGVIQAILTDKQADPQTLLTQAAQEFQRKYLDTLGK